MFYFHTCKEPPDSGVRNVWYRKIFTLKGLHLLFQDGRNFVGCPQLPIPQLLSICMQSAPSSTHRTLATCMYLPHYSHILLFILPPPSFLLSFFIFFFLYHCFMQNSCFKVRYLLCVFYMFNGTINILV